MGGGLALFHSDTATFRHPVTPTPIPALTEALYRRGSSTPATADSMSYVPESVCGYKGAILNKSEYQGSHCITMNQMG